MDFDVGYVAVILIASCIGFVYLHYGRKQAEIEFIVCGVALMAYAYFVSSTGWAAAIGAVLAAGPFLYRRFG